MTGRPDKERIGQDMKYVIDSETYEKHIRDEVHLYGLLHQLAFLAGKVKDAEELTPLTAVLKEHDAKIREKQRAVTAHDPAYIISGSAFRMLVGDLFDLLAQYSFLCNRVVDVKTEKQLARLQKNLSGEHPAIRRMYRKWGIPDSTGVTGFDMLESAIRRTHLTPYDPEETADDGIGCGRCCALCGDHSCEDDYD